GSRMGSRPISRAVRGGRNAQSRVNPRAGDVERPVAPHPALRATEHPPPPWGREGWGSPRLPHEGGRNRSQAMPQPLSGTRRRLGLLIAATSFAALVGAAPEQAPIFFNTNFEGGSLGTIERLGETTFRCHVQGQHDERGRNRQASWYYFRMDGVRGRDITLTL